MLLPGLHTPGRHEAQVCNIYALTSPIQMEESDKFCWCNLNLSIYVFACLYVFMVLILMQFLKVNQSKWLRSKYRSQGSLQSSPSYWMVYKINEKLEKIIYFLYYRFYNQWMMSLRPVIMFLVCDNNLWIITNKNMYNLIVLLLN